MCTILSACAVDEGPALGQPGFVGGFYGGVAADEPHAVIAARDVLTAGGTAADAAVALSFALSVTLPTRAGLGAGGSCVVHDAGLGLTEALDFLPRIGTGKGQVPTTIPSLARAMLVLHARYGRLDWREVLAPAEQLARFGHRPSRALRRELTALWPLIQRDPMALKVFGGDTGAVPTPETNLRQVQLASILGQIRVRGAGVMYSGSVSQAIADSYNRVGGVLTAEDIRGLIPEWRVPVATPFFNGRTLFVPPPPDNGGVVLAQSAGLIEVDDRFVQATGEDRVHLLVQAMRKSFEEKDAWINTVGLPIESLGSLVSEDKLEQIAATIDTGTTENNPASEGVPITTGGATGFVVVDSTGMTVACTLTIGGPLGTRKMLDEYGFYPGWSPGPAGTWLTPAVVVSEVTSQMYYASAGTDGSSGLAATLSLLSGVNADSGSLESLVGAPRFFLNPGKSEILVEPGLNPASLTGKGQIARTGRSPSRINVVYCPSGYPVDQEKRRCAIATDSRGDGLSVLAE
ncbi:MAG: gamma-glutamyltransferase [Alphaproteobacteria bacterium]